MIEVWLDNQLPPLLARWLQTNFQVSVRPVRDIGLRHSTDLQIFEAAFAAGAVVMTKDADFQGLADERREGPQIVWLKCGNTTNARLREIMAVVFPRIIRRLESGSRLVEIEDESSLA